MASGGKAVKTQHFDPPKGTPEYLKRALDDIGIQEWVLNDKRKRVSNPVVEGFMKKAVGSKANMMTTPWCAYWVGAKLEDANIPGSKSGMARSYLKWGIGVDHTDDTKWKVGDIVVTWRGRSNDGVTGHIFFLLSWNSDEVVGLGGNQGDRVSIQAFRRSKIIGIRRPRSFTDSRIGKGTGGAILNETVIKQGVDAAIPDPTPVAKPDLAQNALDTIDKIQTPMQTLSDIKPAIMVVLSAITVCLLLYVAWRRYRDHQERGI